MGLLDDAIREHLDLKRRRGADPNEIERAEREALGPVRRGPDVSGEEPAVAASEAGLEASHTDPEAGLPEHEEISGLPPAEPWEPFQEDPELRALDDHDELPPYEPPRRADGDPLMDDEQISGEAHDSIAAQPAEPAPEAESRPAPHPAEPRPASPYQKESASDLDQETEEYELEPEHGSDDDVLETTPEFLQDAPEHDRLWFEQRPPRDFDFDG